MIEPGPVDRRERLVVEPAQVHALDRAPSGAPLGCGDTWLLVNAPPWGGGGRGAC